MPVPFAAVLGGSVIAGLVQFFTTKAGTILAGLGLTFIGVKGFETFLGFIIGDFQTITSALQGQAGSIGGAGAGRIALQFLAFVGFFDGLNIVISGFMAFNSLLGLRLVLGRLK